jgi:hypothetical protein
MNIETRVKKIVSLTMEDFHNSLKSISGSPETLIEWLSSDLLLLEDVEDLTTIEISLLILEKLNCLDLVDLSMIIEKVADSLKNSENEIIHISIPKIL